MNMPLEETLLSTARKLRDPVARSGFLIKACGDDDALRARIEALLHSEPAGALSLSAADTARPAPLETVGDTIDRYRLLQQIGEDGCGVTYMAEQLEPVRRKVALKIIKVGIDASRVIARFDAERQALAMLDHPNIAKVLDAGATRLGRSYFVTELVRGVSITRYCDQNNLEIPQRLRLFIAVCHAVQHAHQKGIIHRDIKPSNILVTLREGAPIPKVVDFGVGRAIEARLTDLTLLTEIHAFMGAPAYTSPEQAEMSGLDIDTRADIYSLGALLYELLCGRPPFDSDKLLKAGLDEMRRTLREVKPPRPSARLSTLAKLERAQIATQRGVEPGRLCALLRGDLDSIVMKALEKDRARRYNNAGGLALDLQRYLGNEPVLARPPNAVYLLRKFVRRHRTGLAGAGAVLLALIALIAASTWQAVRATRAERAINQERAKAVHERDRARDAERRADDRRQLAEKERHEAGDNLYAARMNLAQAAWNENDPGQLREILEGTRTYPDRSFEWFYWSRQTHLELRTLRGHSSAVLGVAVSPDGGRIVTGSFDGTARIWDVETGRELRALHSHAKRVFLLGSLFTVASGGELLLNDGQHGGVLSVAFSPDGRRIVTGRFDGTARVWDAATGQEQLVLKGHAERIWSVAFSPDGHRIFTGSGDKTIKMWDADTGKELLTLKGHPEMIYAVAFSPDGKRLVAGSNDKTARILDAKTGRELLALKGHTGLIRSTAFSPDGARVVTGSDDGAVGIWNSLTGQELLAFRGHAEKISAVAFSPDGGRIVTGSDDRTAKIWSGETGQELLTLKGHTGRVRSAAFSPDGTWVVTGSDDATAKVWDAKTGRELPILKWPGQAQAIDGAVFSPDIRRMVTFNDDLTTRVWEVETGKELLNLSDLRKPGAFSPDGGRVVTGSSAGAAKVWDVKDGRVMLTLGDGPVEAVTWSSDGRRIVTGGSDGTARVWDAESGRELLTLRGSDGRVESVAVSNDGRRIVTGTFGKVAKVWDAETGRETLTLKGHLQEVSLVAFSPDGERIVTGSGDGTVKVWNAETGQELTTVKSGAVSSAAFSHDGLRIITSDAGQSAKVWNAATGQELLALSVPGDLCIAEVLSPDARRIVVCATDPGGKDSAPMVWKAASPEQIEAWQKEDDAREPQRRFRALAGDLSRAISNKNWDEADLKFAAVEKLLPDEQRADLNLTHFKILIGKKDYVNACKLAEETSETRKDDAETQNDLAWDIVTSKSVEARGLELAEKFATRANEAANGASPNILDTLARVLFMRGKKEEAIQMQQRAVTVAEDQGKPGYQKTLDSYRGGILPELD